MTASGVTTYTWDPGHLTQVVSQDTTVTYAYGMSGMRERKTIERPGVPTVWTKSVYTGDLLAAEYDSDGTRYTYLWGPDRQPLSVTRLKNVAGAVPETFAYHTDALGSVVAMTDEDGVAVATYEYDPYGRCTVLTGEEIATRNPLRYRAYYSDAETGLFYLPARYYDPATYRFLSQDPAAPSAGDPLSLNAYAYCLGDPVDYTDPSGATVDVDGDGRLDSEDGASESYIQTPSSSKRKAVRRANMQSAVARANARRVAELNRKAMMGMAIGRVGGGGGSLLDEVSGLDWSMMPTGADSWDVGADAIGAGLEMTALGLYAGGMADCATVAGAPAGLPLLAASKGLMLVEIALDLVMFSRKATQFVSHRASAGDVAMVLADFAAGASPVPIPASATRLFTYDLWNYTGPVDFL